MLDISIKKLFFDRAKVIRAMDASTRKALSKAGAFIRKRAQTSMKYRKKGASPPGTPPYAHRDGRGPLLRKFLYFGYEPNTQSVVVGPVRLLRGEAPKLNEFGGTVQRKTIVKQATRKATPAQAAAYRRKLQSGQIVRKKQPVKVVSAKYPKRSFMGPALEKEVAAGTIPNQWGNSIKGL